MMKNPMTDKELRRLKRSELLEILYEQEKEIAELRKKLNRATRKLEDRRILIEESGSIAEVALRLNEVFEAAQAAADQYLENIRALGDQEET